MKKKDDAQQQVLMTAAEAKQRMADALAQKVPLGTVVKGGNRRLIFHSSKLRGIGVLKQKNSSG